MSKAKHTPGPWQMHRYAGDCFHISGNGHIASLTCGSGDERAKTNANARLIAAAPDLLAVARMAANVKGALAKTLGAKAQAAIAKAEGS